MLDLPRMRRIRLASKPKVQRAIAQAFLTPLYEIGNRVNVSFEKFEALPGEPVIFAMNHTDRYNYWPFQYRMWKTASRFTATWVKGKYYENAMVGRFMELTNNIPTVSRGYLITRDFVSTMKRRPTDEEYNAMRKAVDGSSKTSGIPDRILMTPRDMLGRNFRPTRESYAHCVNALFLEMMQLFFKLNADAFGKGLDLIVFPQGTRSTRLSRGHAGVAQIALKLRKTIVPIACNGSDSVYPGSSPIARPGRVTYRMGKPIRYDEMEPFHVPGDFVPFTPAVEREHRAHFQGLVDLVMRRINDELDPEYQFSFDQTSEGVAGASRFV